MSRKASDFPCPDTKRQKLDPMTEEKCFLASFAGDMEISLSVIAERSGLDRPVVDDLANALTLRGLIYPTVGDFYCICDEDTIDDPAPDDLDTISFSQRIRVALPLLDRKERSLVGRVVDASELRATFPAFPRSSSLCQFGGTIMTPDCVPCWHANSYILHLWNVRKTILWIKFNNMFVSRILHAVFCGNCPGGMRSSPSGLFYSVLGTRVLSTFPEDNNDIAYTKPQLRSD